MRASVKIRFILTLFVMISILLTVGCSKSGTTTTADTAAPDSLANLSSSSPGCTNAVAPAAPAGLQAVAGSDHVTLTWTAAADVSGYVLTRNNTILGDLTGAGVASYIDNGLSASTIYNYSLVAVNSCAKASAAATVSVTTSASAGSPVDDKGTPPYHLAAGDCGTNGVSCPHLVCEDSKGKVVDLGLCRIPIAQ